MTVILILRKEHFPRGRILAQLVGMGTLGYVGQSFLYLTAINYASAGLVALLLYLYPFFVTVLSMIFLLGLPFGRATVGDKDVRHDPRRVAIIPHAPQ